MYEELRQVLQSARQMEQESSKVNQFQPLRVVCRPEVAVSHYPQIQWLCGWSSGSKPAGGQCCLFSSLQQSSLQTSTQYKLRCKKKPNSELDIPNSPQLFCLLEKEMATHSSILAQRIPWTEEPGRLQSVGSQESDMTQRLNCHQHSVLILYCVLVPQSCPTLCYGHSQAPLSMEFSKQEYWHGLPFPSLGALPDPVIKPGSPTPWTDSTI